MSKWVLNKAGAVSVELILNRLQKFPACGGGALDRFIDIGKIYI